MGSGCDNEPSLLGGRQNMAKALSFVVQLKIWKDTRGQDMLEYGCFMAAIVLLYAAFSPSVATGLVNVFSRISSNLSTAAGV
jgi:Flp pilus assembly pilin Flp